MIENNRRPGQVSEQTSVSIQMLDFSLVLCRLCCFINRKTRSYVHSFCLNNTYPDQWVQLLFEYCKHCIWKKKYRRQTFYFANACRFQTVHWSKPVQKECIQPNLPLTSLSLANASFSEQTSSGHPVPTNVSGGRTVPLPPH